MSKSELIPYFGRSKVLSSSSSEVQALIKDSTLLLGEISKVANSDNEWKILKEELHEIIQKLISDECKYECYKINILKNALIPYIRQMNSRLILNRKRFQQIQMMLRILCTTYSSDDHPSNVLREMEVIVTSIDAEGGWWRSEFASKIQHTVALEWVPILADNRLITLVFLFDSFARKGLQSVASKLLFVGLIDFFRSGLFILPILTLLAEIALIVQKINNKSGFSPENIIKLLKSSLLLMVAAMAIRIIGMLPGLGYSASMLGLLIFIISSVDPLLKLLCPYVAPNMAQLSSFAQRMETLENQVTESVRKILDKEHFTSTVKSVSEYVLAKELISNADIPTDLSMNRNETMGQEPSSIDIGTGLRKRKVA